MLETLPKQLRGASAAGERSKIRRRKIELVSNLIDLPRAHRIEFVLTDEKRSQAAQETLKLWRAIAV
ncbi:hypothetical protein AC628_09145 [Bradyrhizobium sp. NAS96.2]|nr:hypothetical protein AC628_09145 [Bradyrhizobium sp. NAS96.2]